MFVLCRLDYGILSDRVYIFFFEVFVEVYVEDGGVIVEVLD